MKSSASESIRNACFNFLVAWSYNLSRVALGMRMVWVRNYILATYWACEQGYYSLHESLSRVRQNRTSEKKRRSATSVDEYILCTNPYLDSRNRGSTGRLYPTNPLNKIRKKNCWLFWKLSLNTFIYKYVSPMYSSCYTNIYKNTYNSK